MCRPDRRCGGENTYVLLLVPFVVVRPADMADNYVCRDCTEATGNKTTSKCCPALTFDSPLSPCLSNRSRVDSRDPFYAIHILLLRVRCCSHCGGVLVIEHCGVYDSASLQQCPGVPPQIRIHTTYDPSYPPCPCPLAPEPTLASPSPPSPHSMRSFVRGPMLTGQ